MKMENKILKYMKLYTVASTIKAHYKFIKEPSLEEVESILDAVSKQNSIKAITDSDLDKIIEIHVKDRRIVVNASVDMSGSSSILQQILNAAKNR